MTKSSFWRGVIPAITTPFTADDKVDHAFLARHARVMMDAGCTGMVPLGSLGEGATLSFDEKVAIMRTLVKELGSAPVIPGIAALSTAEAVELAREAKAVGCQGMMVLPPYVYSTDWHEMSAHVSAVIAATDLPCLLYNNPLAYKTDFSPEQLAALAANHSNVEAVKESSGDIRRIASLKSLVGDRLEILVGIDDIIVESLQMGATGWIAGMVNAFPKESVDLFERAQRPGGMKDTEELYSWFLPTLRLDTVPKFVQLIKLAQAEVNLGSEQVRAPRLRIEGAEREAALRVIRTAIANRPE